MTIRALNAAEENELGKLISAINRIVTKADPAKLTEVLGAPAMSNEGAAFQARFRVLPRCAEELRQQGLIVVDTELPPEMGANARIDADKHEAKIHVQPNLVNCNSSASVYERAIMLLHELTHTWRDTATNDFPIKDYTYRKSWGHGYLPPSLGLQNADTYAEAAAQLAEDINPGKSYRERGRVAYQREGLRKHLPETLYPALAYVDIRVNRAWLRSTECEDFSKATVGRQQWEEGSKFKEKWSKSPFYSQLLLIENKLFDWNILAGGPPWWPGKKSVRWAGPYPTVGLSGTDQATMTAIRCYMSQLKDVLNSKVDLRLAETGEITYLDERLLKVPRNAIHGSPAELGEHILKALVETVRYSASDDKLNKHLNKHKIEIIGLLVEYGQQDQKILLEKELQTGFQKRAAKPTDNAWNDAKIEVGLGATVQILADTAAAAKAAQGAERDFLRTLLTDIKPDIEFAKTEVDGWLTKAPPDDRVKTQLQPNLGKLFEALVDIRTAVFWVDATEATKCNAYIDQINEHIKNSVVIPALPMQALAAGTAATTAAAPDTVLHTAALNSAPAVLAGQQAVLQNAATPTTPTTN